MQRRRSAHGVVVGLFVHRQGKQHGDYSPVQIISENTDRFILILPFFQLARVSQTHPCPSETRPRLLMSVVELVYIAHEYKSLYRLVFFLSLSLAYSVICTVLI